MRAIGYRRALVVHGFDRGEPAIDELSTLGATLVHEIRPDGGVDEDTLAPEDVGVRRAEFADIATTGDPVREAERFLLVLAGRAAPACTEIACLNAAAVLLVAGRAPDLPAGVRMSRDLLQSGKAFETLCRWVQAQADGDARAAPRFRECARRVGLADQVTV
jgi:anthranilate phosphoribosyltransferase